MWHVKSKFLPFFWHLGAFWQLLRNVHKISLSMHSIQNAAQKCPVIIWVYIDVKNWSPKDVTCHVISSVKSCVPKTVRVKSNLMHSVRNAAQKCPVIIWVCIDDKKWSRKDVTCHVHYFYPSFFCGILGVRAGILGKHGKLLLLLAAQKHRVIYALRHWHRRKTLHSDLFLRNTFAKYTSSLRH